MLTDDELINAMTGAPNGWSCAQTLLHIGHAVEAAVLAKQAAPRAHKVEQNAGFVQPCVTRAVDCAHEEGCCSPQCQVQRRCAARPDGVRGCSACHGGFILGQPCGFCADGGPAVATLPPYSWINELGNLAFRMEDAANSSDRAAARRHLDALLRHVREVPHG